MEQDSRRPPLQPQVRLTAVQIATALGAKPAGENKWKALCPAHDDKNPSLSIAESPRGKVLLKCWAGCGQSAVIKALQDRGLWPKAEYRRRGVRRLRVDPATDDLLTGIYWFLLRSALVEVELQALDDLLQDAEFCSAEAPYMVVGQILEDAAKVTYHTLLRVAEVLRGKGGSTERHVERWVNERYPTALFEPRP